MKAKTSSDTAAAVAFDKGTYKRFTGWILYGRTDGWVENASFILTDEPVSDSQYIVSGGDIRNVFWIGGAWKSGAWGCGIWCGGTWESGDWLGGKWMTGTWMSGTWKTGVWMHGRWRSGEWLGGDWRFGSFWNERLGEYIGTRRDPHVMGLREERWRSQ